MPLLIALLVMLPTTTVTAMIPTPTLVVGQPRLTLSASVSSASVLPGASFAVIFVAGTNSQEPRRIRVRLQHADWFTVADATTNSGTCVALDCTLAASSAARVTVRLRLVVRPGTPPGSLIVQASASDDLQNTAAAEPVRVEILAPVTATPSTPPPPPATRTAEAPLRPTTPPAPGAAPKSTARPRTPRPSSASPRPTAPPQPLTAVTTPAAPPADDRGGSNPAPTAPLGRDTGGGSLPALPAVPPAPAPGDQP